jgi:hypothetical protein
MKRNFAGFLLTAFLVLSSAFPSVAYSPSGPASATTGNFHGKMKEVFDWSIPALYSLPRCESSKQLDCVDSVSVFDNSGKLKVATWQRDTYQPVYTDALGNKMNLGQSIWMASVDGRQVSVGIAADAESPTHGCCRMPDGSIMRFGSIRSRVIVDEPLTTKVQFKIRTSWIKPLNVPLFAAEASFSQAAIPGGNLWTFAGKGVAVSGYSDNWDEKLESNARADFDSTVFYFTIDHAGLTDELSPFPKSCSEFGYTAQASNASSAGMPSWNSKTNSLDFAIEAPHTTTKGEKNLGFFQFWANDKYLKCKFPRNTLSTASQVKIQVFDANGELQTATYVAKYEKGLLYVAAFGFHYSSPTVRLTPVTAAKKTTITCVNSKTPKLTKKVTAISPKCPVGYKASKRIR